MCTNFAEMKAHHLQNFHVLKLKVCEKCDAVFRMQREQDTQHAWGYADCFGVQRETDNYVVMEKKLSRDAGDRTGAFRMNRGLSHAKRTLYHWATSPSWKIGLLKHIYLLSHTTSLLW